MNLLPRNVFLCNSITLLVQNICVAPTVPRCAHADVWSIEARVSMQTVGQRSALARARQAGDGRCGRLHNYGPQYGFLLFVHLFFILEVFFYVFQFVFSRVLLTVDGVWIGEQLN
jgi:hypothetical protein